MVKSLRWNVFCLLASGNRRPGRNDRPSEVTESERNVATFDFGGKLLADEINAELSPTSKTLWGEKPQELLAAFAICRHGSPRNPAGLPRLEEDVPPPNRIPAKRKKGPGAPFWHWSVANRIL